MTSAEEAAATIAPPPVAPPLTGPLLFLVTALLGFTLLKEGTDLVATQEPQLAFAWAGAVGALTAAFLWVDPRPLPRFALRALRGSAIFLAFYFVVEPFAVPYAALPAGHPAVLLHQHGRPIGLVLAVIGWWRPSAVFGSAMLLWMMRELQTELTGFYFSTLDIRNVAEIVAFLSIGFTLLAGARQVRGIRQTLAVDDALIQTATMMMLAAAIGAHLANYFWSGLAKLALDGGFLSWLLDNRLSDGIPAALEKGTLPFAAWPWAVEAVHGALVFLSVPINFLSWSVQILAVVAVWKRRWLILATIAFDVFHVIVWATLGLLFWKWIALNMIVVATLAAVREDEWNKVVRTTAVLFVIAGIALFRVATLAWYETAGFASPYFVARMDDGSLHRVPNAYFGSSSYQVSQGRLWYPGGFGHFNPSIWGSVLSHKDAVAGRTCTVPARTEPAAEQWGPPHHLALYMQAQHKRVLAHADERGIWHYYRVPHHHVPSPFLADSFYALDKRRVASYMFVMDSVCLSLDQGRLKRHVVKRSVLPLYDARVDRVLQ